MKRIDISTPKHPNTFTLVDDGDYERLNAYKWHVHKNGYKFYVSRNIRVGSKQKTLLIHTVIMGKVKDKMVDHRNGNALDNQRCNLRICTNTENIRNRGPQRNNGNGYKGVSWYKRGGKWQATIEYNGESIYLGRFFCIIKAAKIYDQKAKEFFGEFAWLNFPEGGASNDS